MDDIAMNEESSDSGRPNNQLQDEDDDDDLYYIPSPRSDIDLGQDPAQILSQRAASPAMSYTSMSSDGCLDMHNRDFLYSCRTQLERTDSYSSCYSIDSDDCERKIPKVKMKESTASSSSETPDYISEANDLRQDCLSVEFSYKAISDTLRQLSEADFKKFGKTMWKNYPKSFSGYPEEFDTVGMADRLLECYGLSDSLYVTMKVLKEMGRMRVADHLQNRCLLNEVRHDLAQSLRTTYGINSETTPFTDGYADLCVTSTSGSGPNIEHEVLQIELNCNQEAGRELSSRDILSQEQVVQSHVTLAFLTGVAGSGKSTLVRKMILDWVDKRSHQHVSFLFPLPFRKLQQFENEEVSLLDILHSLYPETQRLKGADLSGEDCTVMLVCDGLDEYHGELDFSDTELLNDHTERTSLNVLVVNLLRGRLLYRGLFLITTRPQVRSFIPWDAHHQLMEVRGFCDDAKADFFQKKFEDQTQASAVLSLLQSNPTLWIMCHLPLFCSVVADECRHRFQARRSVAGLSLCYVYTKFLVVLMYQRPLLSAPLDFFMRLGHLAFHLLEQGKFNIYKSEWSEFGVSDVEAVTHSGLCTEYLTKPFILYEEKVISFIHPTLQEHLAALYSFLSFKNLGKNVFEAEQLDSFSRFLKGSKKSFYYCAVDRSLQCGDGRLDFFLRFLTGLHLKANMEPLARLGITTQSCSSDEEAALLRKKCEKNQHPRRKHNLMCCLQELQQT